MSEHLRAFVVIAVLSSLSFVVLRGPVLAMGMAQEDFARRRNLWLAATVAAFLANSFWIFVVSIGCLLLVARRERNPLALYFFLIFAVPPFAAALSGLGVVNKLFELSFPRLLALLVLLPAALRSREPGAPPFGRHLADWMVVGYLALQLVLQLRSDSITNVMRSGVEALLDAFLPYYVASRSLRSGEALRDALLALVVGVLLLVPVAVFEFVRYWLLYAALPAALGMQWDGIAYLGRGNALRAVATTGHSIVLGCVMAVALQLHTALRPIAANPRVWAAGAAALVIGLVVTVSRGPWVGAVAGVLVVAAASRRPARRLTRLLLPAGLVLSLLAISPWGGRLLDYLPFVGTVDEGNVNYRQTLFEVSLKVISQEPWFGSPYFMYAEPMQALRIGSLIDVVNGYLLVALRTGLVGLSLFVGVYVAAFAAVVQALRRQPDEDTERFAQGRALLGTLAAMAVTIATVSDISFIPLLGWCSAGLSVGYARLVGREFAPVRTRRRTLATGMP